MCSPLWYTPNPHRRVHATRAHTSTHVALAHTHEHRRAYIYATHHALHVVSSILSISALLRHVLRSHLLDVRRRRQTVAVLKCRKSKIGRTNMCASIGATRDPRSGTLSAVAAQMLSDTRFGCARPRAQSPHLGLTLPPRVGRMHLRHATRSGREIRGSENRLRIAPRGCARYHESEDTCAPVRVAASRIDPPAKRWRTMDFHATGIEAEEFEWRHSHNGSSNR